MAFGEIDPQHHNFDYPSNSRFIISWLLQSLWLHTQREDGTNTSYYSLPKETVAAIMMLYKNMKVKVRSPDGDRLLWHGSRCATRRYISSIIICLDNVLRMSIDLMKDNGFKLAKERSRRYLAQTIMDADYADDMALLANTPAQAETLLDCLERAAGGIGPHVNADKMEYMCFNERGDISTLKGGLLKLVDKFTYLGSSVSSIKKDINMWLAKVWTAIERLSVIWKSDLPDKIKHSFFPSSSCLDTAIWMHYMDANWMYG